MEKEKMQKENKKGKKNQIKYDTTNEAQELKSFLIVVLVVIICVGLVYVLTRAFVTKDLFEDKEDDTKEVVEGKVNYDVAIIGQLLNMPESEYYAVIYNTSEGEYISDMSSLVYSYNALEKHLHMYTIDLSNKLNADYYDPENVNEGAKIVSDLHVGDITLIKVKNGEIDKYITDYAKMQKELGVK